MRASVGRDDAPVQIFLVEDRDVARALHDAVVSTVGALPHQGRDAVGEAALAGIGIEVRLVRARRRSVRWLGPRPSWHPACMEVWPSFGSTTSDVCSQDLPRPAVVLPEAVVLVPANRRLADRAPAHRRAFGARQPLRRLFLLDPLDSLRPPRR